MSIVVNYSSADIFHFENGYKKQVGHSVDEVLVKEPPFWWKGIYNGIGEKVGKSEDFIMENWNDIINGSIYDNTQIATNKTVKHCPAFPKLITNTMVIKSPCDIMIETSERGETRTIAADSFAAYMGITFHDVKQIDNDDDWIIIKFMFNYILDAPTWVQYIDPFYWKKDIPYRIAPGIVDCDHIPLNIITFWPRQDKKHMIKAGDVIGTLLFGDKISGLEYKDMTEGIERKKWLLTNRIFDHKNYNK